VTILTGETVRSSALSTAVGSGGVRPRYRSLMDPRAIDAAIETLAANRARWARLPLSTKIFLLDDLRRRVGVVSDEWVDSAVGAKGIASDSPIAGEEWTSGPYAVASAAGALAETLRRLDAGVSVLTGIAIHPVADDQVAVRVFPTSKDDRLLLSGHTADVWMQPGRSAEDVRQNAARFYHQTDPAGAVAAVLGAGNLSSIPALDLLTEMYTHGSVVALKLSPVNDYLAEIFEEVFAEFIQGGFVRLVRGGTAEGVYLTRHPLVDRVHVTGSARTHDAIVFGTGPDGAARKTADDPVTDITVTAELGGVGPTVVVPGDWSKADLRYQAEHIISQKLHNHGFNCVACQVLVLPDSWGQADALLDEMRAVAHEVEERFAYFPGAEARQRTAVAAHPHAEILTDGVAPVTFITNLDPSRTDDVCFTTEFFGAVLGVVRIPGDDVPVFLENAVSFVNETLDGNLGANLIIHPATEAAHVGALERAIRSLRYGTIAVNSWVGVAYALTRATWGAFPGNTRRDIRSGNGIVHNALMLEGVERTVVRGPFAPFPRTIRQRVWHTEPLPPHFVTNQNAARIGEQLTAFAVTQSWKPIPGLLAAALRA